MAINKRKILQSAQKHLQKGSLDRALKDYKTLLEADPRDVNVRLKIGDIHLRQGHSEEAVTAYLKVAEKFAKDGFDAKAVALYKQITKIDPKRQEVHVPLAELYQRLGLTSDAMKSLQTAADAHYKEGDKPAALDVLRKMATLDPGNTTNRLKVAELLRQEGMNEEALSEYRECAAELGRQGDPEGQLRVLEKVVDLVPGDLDAWGTVGRANLVLSRWSGAEKVGNHLLENFPEHTVEACELLAEAYGGLRKDDQLPALYQKMAEALRDRGEEDKAREILQRYVPGEEMAVAGDEPPEAEAGALFGDDALETEAGISHPPGGAAEIVAPPAEPAPAPIAEAAIAEAAIAEAAITQAPITGAAADDAPTGEGAAEQLFAEANVFRRYGKNDRAIETLRSILALEPQDTALLTRLAESFEGCGAMSETVEALSRAACCARDQGDASSFATLCARVETLDPAAAQALGGAPAAEPASVAAAAADEIEIDVDLDTDIESGIEIDTGTEATAAPVDVSEAAPQADSIEIDLDEPPDLTDSGVAAPNLEAASGSEPEEELSFEDDSLMPQAEVTTPGGMDLEFDFDDGTDDGTDASGLADAPDDVAVLDDEPAAPAPEAAAAERDAALDEEDITPPLPDAEFTSPERISEALDEAAFYLQQGLYDESEAVYRRILESAPSHPQALLRLGEIEAARAADTAEPVAPPEPEQVLEDVTDELDVPDLASEDSTPELDVPECESAVDLGEDLGAALAAELDAEDEEEQTAPIAAASDAAVELDLGDDDDESLEDALAAAAASVSDEPIHDETISDEAILEEPVIDEPEPEPEPDVELPVAEAGESGDFDLAKELSGVFHDDEEVRRPTSEGTQEEGFEAVFAAFKKGVDETLDEGDHEAHYDLGIAYREMGLIDDAMNEFRAALAGEGRRVGSLHMLGLCAMETGQGADAVSHFEQALSLPDVPPEHQLGLRFDLGRAYQEQGDRERARAAWEAVAAIDPAFCDVGDHLAALDGLGRPPTDSEFESFEDLVAEAEEDDRAQAGEGYESFEDLMAAEPEPEAPLLEAVPFEPEPEVHLEPDPIQEPEPLDEPFAELEAEPIQDPEPFDEPEPEPDPDPEPEPEPEAPAEAAAADEDPKPARKKKRRKKKISFV